MPAPLPYPPEVRCIMCDAPMLRFEYPDHLHACVTIDARRGAHAEIDARIAENAEEARRVTRRRFGL